MTLVIFLMSSSNTKTAKIIASPITTYSEYGIMFSMKLNFALSSSKINMRITDMMSAMNDPTTNVYPLCIDCL